MVRPTYIFKALRLVSISVSSLCRVAVQVRYHRAVPSYYLENDLSHDTMGIHHDLTKLLLLLHLCVVRALGLAQLVKALARGGGCGSAGRRVQVND